MLRATSVTSNFVVRLTHYGYSTATLDRYLSEQVIYTYFRNSGIWDFFFIFSLPSSENNYQLKCKKKKIVAETELSVRATGR